MADYYENESESESMSADGEVDVPEEKLGLVPMSFFKDKVNPGDREMIEVVKVYDGEVAIKCIYGEGKESDEEEDEMEMETGERMAPEEEMMG